MCRSRFASSRCCSGILPLAAQTSSLQGIVTDGQGASDIRSRRHGHESRDFRRRVRALTGDNGRLQLSCRCRPAHYRSRWRSPDSAPTRRVRLQINTPANLDIKLELGPGHRNGQRDAEATAINTQNASIGNPFTENQIKGLPLQTRNVVELLSLQPGVAPTGEVLGAKPDQNNVTLDGVDVNDQRKAPYRTSDGFNAALPVPLDSVQEFRTTVAGQGADQGRSAGRPGLAGHQGRLERVSRIGCTSTCATRLTAANNWFSNRAGIAREPLVRNQYGASRRRPHHSQIARSSSSTGKIARTAAARGDAHRSQRDLSSRASCRLRLNNGADRASRRPPISRRSIRCTSAPVRTC